MKTIVLAVSLSALIASVAFARKDPIGGREILEVSPGTYILTTKEGGGPQIEVTIGQSGYGLAELTTSGTSPFTVLKEGGKVRFIVTTVSDGKEIMLTDRDGDGIPEQRLTIHRDRTGDTTRVVLENVTVHFEESGRREFGAEPGATDNPDDAQRIREDH